MKKFIILFLSILLAVPSDGANDISRLYSTYLSVKGKQRLEVGNQLLDEASQKNLIDSLGHFESHNNEMEMWIHYAAASWEWELHKVKNITSPAQKALALSMKLENLAMQGDCYHLLGAAC